MRVWLASPTLICFIWLPTSWTLMTTTPMTWPNKRRGLTTSPILSTNFLARNPTQRPTTAIKQKPASSPAAPRTPPLARTTKKPPEHGWRSALTVKRSSAISPMPANRLPPPPPRAGAGACFPPQDLAQDQNKQYPKATVVQSYALPTIRAAAELAKKNPAAALTELHATSEVDL